MPTVVGGGIMPEPGVGMPFTGPVADLFNILALFVVCTRGTVDSKELGLDRELVGERISASLVGLEEDGSA